MIKKLQSKRILLMTAFIFLVSLNGCSKKPVDNADNSNKESISTSNYYSFQDSLNNTVTLAAKPTRVVSLLGSYAEAWCLAGGEAELVGVTNDAIEERELKISEDTKMIGTVKDPNLELLLSLSPDFVILSEDIESHLQIAETLKKLNISYAFFDVENFDDYLSQLKVFTDLTEREDLYQKNGLDVEEHITSLLARVNDTEVTQPSTLLIRAFSSGAKALSSEHMVSYMLDDLGTLSVTAEHPSLLTELSMEEIILADPDFIFLITMGDSEKAVEAFNESTANNPAWAGLSAVKNDRYIILPKDLFQYKPNDRWGESYEYLAKILYSESFE